MRDFLYPLRVLHGKMHEHSRERNIVSNIKKRIRQASRDTVMFVMTPEHGNLGDHAIAIATIQMLRELNMPYTEITADELKLMHKHKKMHLMNGRPILVNGGGNIGTLWMGVEKLFRGIIQACPKSAIVCLPNTAYFEPLEQGQYEFAQSGQIYRSHEKLTIFAREKISFELLSKLHDRVVLVPDMVLSLNECRSATRRNGCLLCLRSDRERTRDNQTDRIILDQTGQLFGGNVFYSDMNTGKNIPAKCREEELSKKYDAFRSAELVITDRLHGMIFAAITGTPCIVIDSKSPKVRGCYEWIRELGYICFADSPEQIPDLYRTMPKNCRYTNDHLQLYYDELKKDIAEELMGSEVQR